MFTARAFGNDFFEGIHYENAEKENRLLEMSPRFRTPIQLLERGVTEISFFKLVPARNGRDRKQLVAVADLLDIETRALLVFLSRTDIDRDLPYTVLVADESPGKFDPGQLRFLNLSGAELLARLGDSTFPLAGGFGGDSIFNLDVPTEMPIEFAVRVSDTWRIVYSAGFRPNPNVGTLAIIKPPKRVDSLRIQVELAAPRVYPEPLEGELEEAEPID